MYDYEYRLQNAFSVLDRSEKISIEGGMKGSETWKGKFSKPPENWNPAEHLAKVMPGEKKKLRVTDANFRET